jgi:hypothetical protein
MVSQHYRHCFHFSSNRFQCCQIRAILHSAILGKKILPLGDLSWPLIFFITIIPNVACFFAGDRVQLVGVLHSYCMGSLLETQALMSSYRSTVTHFLSSFKFYEK